jgi:hypothetical protein
MSRRQVRAQGRTVPSHKIFLTKFARGVCPTVASCFLAPGVASGAKPKARENIDEMGISLLLSDSRYDIDSEPANECNR